MKISIIYLLIAIFIFSSLIFAKVLCQEQECEATDTSNEYPLGDNPEIAGRTTFSGEGFWDYCMGSSDDEPVGYSGTLNETYCSATDSFAYDIINCVDYGKNKYEKSYICFDGACIEPVCYSTDSPDLPEYPQGNNSFEPGTTTSKNSPGQFYTDECQEDGVTLKEYYCPSPSAYDFIYVDCNWMCDKKGAVNGRCVQTGEGGYCKCMCNANDPPDCEINGLASYPCGYNPFIRGDATGSEDTVADACKDSDGNPSEQYLTEYYCPTEPETEDWNYEHKIIDCHDWYNTICRDGKCYCEGNINLDDKVNIVDVTSVARCFEAKEEDSVWTSDERIKGGCQKVNLALNSDKTLKEVINIIDITLVAKAFGNLCGCKEGTYNPSTGKCE